MKTTIAEDTDAKKLVVFLAILAVTTFAILSGNHPTQSNGGAAINGK